MKSLFVLMISVLIFIAATGKRRESIQELGRDAYIWGYPAVSLAHVRESMLEKTQEPKNSINHFFHSFKTPDPLLGNFITVAPENLYGWAWIDLSKEPLVLTHPQIKDRFYSIQFIDAYSNLFSIISNRTHGEKAGTFLITPPGWQAPVPEKMIQIRASTPEILVLAQTFVKDSKELANIAKLEKQHQLISLSRWNDGIETDSFKSDYPAARLKINKNLALRGLDFYQKLIQIIEKNPPPTKVEIKEVERFNAIGIPHKKDFDKFSFNTEAKTMLERGIFEGEREIQGRLASGLNPKINGWSYELKSSPFTEDYLLRAAISQLYLFSPPAEESMQMSLDSDSEGRQLNSLYRYILHFEKNDFPAARKMWSVQVLETKKIKSNNSFRIISAINDKSDKLRYNEDGSMDLYFQSEKPKPAQRSNWLPLPRDANFYVILTLFNPHNSALNHKYIAPSLIRQEENTPPKQRFTRTMMAVSR
ncbi:MAG TPA: DUF1254 domain-containing protein [Pseudobdellovibrionaceae bacterium]|jgi:hypothetical protein